MRLFISRISLFEGNKDQPFLWFEMFINHTQSKNSFVSAIDRFCKYIGAYGRHQTKIYDKCDDFNFPIVIFLFTGCCYQLFTLMNMFL